MMMDEFEMAQAFGSLESAKCWEDFSCPRRSEPDGGMKTLKMNYLLSEIHIVKVVNKNKTSTERRSKIIVPR